MSYNAYAIAAGSNTENGDATGAFIPGATKFARAFGGTFETFNNAQNAKKNFFEKIEAGPDNLDIFAYFGHGYNTQLGSAHIYTEADMKEMAALLKKKLNPDAVVVLYACWAGIEGGFSTKLQNELGSGIWVYGHTSKGHSFTNPDVSEVQQSRSPNFRRLYPYGTDLRDPWVVSLAYTDMWIRFPIMYDVYIDRELYAIRLLGTWEVQIAGKKNVYLFEWSRTDGMYSSLASMNQNPKGTVQKQKNLDPNPNLNRGSWTIDDRELRIDWNDRMVETWTLPLKSEGSKGKVGGVDVQAKRLKRNNPGRAQG